MSQVVWQGILVGLVLSIAVGPVMFTLLQTSIREGFWRAMMMEAGVISSDACCIVLAFFSVGQFLDHPAVQTYIFIIGGAVLSIFGLISFIKQSVSVKKARDILRGKKSNLAMLFVKGFLYNLLNPSVIIFWIGAVSIASADYEGRSSPIFTHFVTTLLTVFFFDILKIFFSQKLSRFFKPRNMIVLSKILGLIFMVFGIGLMIRGILM